MVRPKGKDRKASASGTAKLPAGAPAAQPGTNLTSAGVPPPDRRLDPTRTDLKGQMKLQMITVVSVIAMTFLMKTVTWARKTLKTHELQDFSVLSSIEARDSCFNLQAAQSNPSGSSPAVQQLSFCEDAELLDAGVLKGHTLFSCDPNRGNWNTVMGPLKDPSPLGSLWIWKHETSNIDTTTGSLSAESSEPYLLDLQGFPDDLAFHPLGTAYEPVESKLLVINHATERSRIEVFQLSENGGQWVAQYQRSIVHPLATHTPNSLVALPGGRLLVTQDHFFAKRTPGSMQLRQTYGAVLGRTLWASLAEPLTSILTPLLNVPIVADLLSRAETLTGLPLGWVTYVEYTPSASADPESGIKVAKIVAGGISFANGLALSPDQMSLAVASTTTPGVILYRFDENQLQSEEEVALKAYQMVELDMLPDNLAFVPTDEWLDETVLQAARVRQEATNTDKGQSKGSEETSTSDDQYKYQLIVSGHASAFDLLSLAKDPYSRNATNPAKRTKEAPSYTVLVELTEPPVVNAGDAKTAATKQPSSRVTVLHALSRQGPITLDSGRTVGVSSSSSAVLASAGSPQQRMLMVAGLYGEGILVCKV